jgi:hypothetical protein
VTSTSNSVAPPRSKKVSARPSSRARPWRARCGAIHPLGGRPTLAEYAALGHVLVTPDAGPPNPRGLIDQLLARRRLTRRIARTVLHVLVAPFVVARTDLEPISKLDRV